MWQQKSVFVLRLRGSPCKERPETLEPCTAGWGRGAECISGKRTLTMACIALSEPCIRSVSHTSLFREVQDAPVGCPSRLLAEWDRCKHSLQEVLQQVTELPGSDMDLEDQASFGALLRAAVSCLHQAGCHMH